MTNDVRLRAVQPSDLPIFFEQQLDPEATRMAAFPARSHDAFMAHWTKILAEPKAFLSDRRRDVDAPGFGREIQAKDRFVPTE